MIKKIILFFTCFAYASDENFQLYLPGDRDEAYDGATSEITINSAERFAICFWFKSVSKEGGEIIRFSDSNENVLLKASAKANTFLVETQDAQIAMDNIDFRDFRWHQSCIDCSIGGCQTYLDGEETEKIETAFRPLSDENLIVTVGYGAKFEGKVQKLQIGYGSAEILSGVQSETVCQVPYKTVSDSLTTINIPAQDFMITRPIHTRDYESTCNDLMSVDCGLDAITVSISHLHLKSIGEVVGKFRPTRLSLMKSCANYTLGEFTTFTISPPDACGSEYLTTQYDRTLRNSVITYANDGQVFTADFQCQYPIDVTAVEYVAPVKPKMVAYKSSVVAVGMKRFEKNDFSTAMKGEDSFKIELGQMLHMAVVTPDEVDRDLRILIKSCSANDIALLEDFGCVKSGTSYVYANGETPAPRFSIYIPNWVVDFKCKIALCDKGDDCKIKCGKSGSRMRRDADEADFDAQTTPQPDIENMQTTESFIPLQTTAEAFLEEIWTEQKSSLLDLNEIEVVYGPLDWITVTRPVLDTTELPVLDTTAAVTDMEMLTLETNTDIDSELILETGTQESEIDLEEILIIKEKKIILVTSTEKSGDEPGYLPGWSMALILSLSAFGFVLATGIISLRYFRSSEKELLGE